MAPDESFRRRAKRRRRFEGESILGPFFQCAALPDDNSSAWWARTARPCARRAATGARSSRTCASSAADLDRRRAAELEASYGAIRGLQTVREGLYEPLRHAEARGRCA